jgi:methionine-rich copper-binding protein CopC
MMQYLPARRLRAPLATAIFGLLLVPSVAFAHAELEKATPKDGATVEGTPAEIVGTYSEAMDPKGSSLRLLDAEGTQIAKGGVDADDDKRMSITDLPELAPGVYTVKSTTKSAEDGDVDRKEWSFTVAAAPTPSPTPSPSPTPPPSATPTVPPSATPASSPTPASASPTVVPTPAPTPAPSASGSDASGGGDVLLPIVAAVVIVAAVAGVLFSRRERPPSET